MKPDENVWKSLQEINGRFREVDSKLDLLSEQVREQKKPETTTPYWQYAVPWPTNHYIYLTNVCGTNYAITNNVLELWRGTGTNETLWNGNHGTDAIERGPRGYYRSGSYLQSK